METGGRILGEGSGAGLGSRQNWQRGTASRDGLRQRVPHRWWEVPSRWRQVPHPSSDGGKSRTSRDKGASAPQRRLTHLTVVNFERGTLQLPRGVEKGSVGQDLCRALILPRQDLRWLEKGRKYFAHRVHYNRQFLCMIELRVAGWSHSDCG